MRKFISEHQLAIAIVEKVAEVMAAYFFVGIGWWLIADILNINTESLRLWDWIMIALFTRVLLFNNVKFGE